MPSYSLSGLVPLVYPYAVVHPHAVLIGDSLIVFCCYVRPRALHSFPTRRSSDLKVYVAPMDGFETYLKAAITKKKVPVEVVEDRSEEHTSELQSRFDLVCRLLLEKKKPGRSSSSERPSMPRRPSAAGS